MHEIEWYKLFHFRPNSDEFEGWMKSCFNCLAPTMNEENNYNIIACDDCEKMIEDKMLEGFD